MNYKTYTTSFFYFIFITLMSVSVFARDRKAIVESLAEPLPEDKTFYRWQSLASGNNLLETGTFEGKLYNYFMGMPYDPMTMVAGKGMYISENFHSSSRFIRGDSEGSLIEVSIKKGTKYLDLTDPSTVKKLESKGIFVSHVYQLDPDIIVKYDEKEKWWVVKSQKGVSFRPFTGAGLKDSYLLKILDKIEESKPRSIYRERLFEIFKTKLATDPNLALDPLVQRSFSKKEISEMILGDFQYGSSAEFKATMDKIAKYNLLNYHLKEPKSSNKILSGMNKYLSAQEMFDLLKGQSIEEMRISIQYMSENTSPKKYLELIQKIKPEIGQDTNKKLELGNIPESKVSTGMTDDIRQQISKISREINLMPQEMDRLFEVFHKEGKLSKFAEYALISQDPELMQKVASKWKVNIDDWKGLELYAKLNLSREQAFELIRIRKGRLLPLGVMTSLLAGTKNADDYIDMVNKFKKITADSISLELDVVKAVNNTLDRLISHGPTGSQLPKLAGFFQKIYSNPIRNNIGMFLKNAKNMDDFLIIAEKFPQDKSNFLFGSSDIKNSVIDGLKDIARLNPTPRDIDKLFKIASKHEWNWFPDHIKNFNSHLLTAKTGSCSSGLDGALSFLKSKFLGK